MISYVKHSPDTCGEPAIHAGIRETPFSSIVFSSAPLTWQGHDDIAERQHCQHLSTSDRVRGRRIGRAEIDLQCR